MFKVIKEYKKDCRLQDVVLCKDLKTGYLECFHRFDIMGKEALKEYDISPYRPWTKQEDEYIKSCVLMKKTVWETYKNLDSANRTEQSTRHRMQIIKMEMGIT